jgi:hypothetical protein
VSISRLRAGGIAPAGAAAVVLLALAAATLTASLFGGKVFSSGDNIFLAFPFAAHRPSGFIQPSNFLLTDPVQGFIPDLLQMRSNLSHGVLPLWNPDAGGGRPQFASQVASPLFPLTWLSVILPFWHSLAWIAAAKLLLAALGTYLYVRELGLRRGPALLAGIAYGWGMFFVVWLEHPQTDVWLCLPWMFLAMRRIAARGSLGATALLGASTGLAWLGGHPESGGFQLAAAALYGAFELIAERRTSAFADRSEAPWAGPEWTRPIRGRAMLMIAGLVLGLGLSAVVVLPLLEVLHQSGPTNRGGAALPMSTLYAFFFPELWGMPNQLSASFVGPVNFNERTAYIGAMPLLLAIGAFLPLRRRPREIWFMVAMVVVCAAVTFNFPIIADAVRKLPEANVARLTRFLIVLSFGAAVLAAYGLQRWQTGDGRERTRMLIAMVVVAVIPPLYWVIANPHSLSFLGSALGQLPAIGHGERSIPVIQIASVWRWTLICAIGLTSLALTRRRRGRWPAVTAVALIVLTAVDLVTLDHGYHGEIPLSHADPPATAAMRYMTAHQGVMRVTAGDEELQPNIGQRYGFRDPRVGIDIPFPSRYSKLWAAYGMPIADLDAFVTGAPRAHALADLFAVRYVLVGPGLPVPRWLTPVLRTSGGTVARNPTALPRAWVAYDWRNAHAAGNALAIDVGSSTRSLRDAPVIEGAAPPPGGPAAPVSVARVTDTSTEQVTIHAAARRRGYLVLDDSAFPGWEATVNGRVVPWQPANENFRAVAVPAGRDTIVFRYEPASIRDGAIISVVCLLALLGLAAGGGVSARRRRARRAPAQTPADRAAASA